MGASAKAVDFTNVKDRGNFNPKRIAEGDYLATITKVEDAESKKDDSNGFMYVFTFKVEKFSQNSYPYYCKLTETQLWKLRNVLVAAGLNVPKKRMKLDPNKVVGKKVGVTMEDDEYEGKPKSVIGAVFPASELADLASSGSEDDDFDEAPEPVEDDDATEDEPKKKDKKKDKKGGKKKKSSDEENLEDLDISDV